jgi:alanyl-tRNA synthetase
LTGDELRQSFVNFFVQRGHVELPSLPLVPQDDPSVLFVIAGMQQMIPFFTGQASPPAKRLVSIQKCLRNVDIEEVGDESHLTFFEMLGNFSVGDYFVPEALRFSWDYLTGVVGIDHNRLWITIYPGDTLARDTWLEIGMPPDRIVDDPENWWARPGLAGPAGPDSEIHFDRGVQYGCGDQRCGPVCQNQDCHRFVEIWNNVFMDSFVDERGEVQRELASKNIDTGQGFERLLMVIQGVETVYETDVFLPVIDAVAGTIGITYKSDESADRSLRIIADHSRALTMAIADGALPSNEGRGYVLRRLLRRAVLRGRLLGIERPFLAQPVQAVIETMKSRYPEVEQQRETILRTIQLEEERFEDTLARGLPMVDRLLDEARRNAGVIPGEEAFLLHDTYGMPLELIQEVAGENGFTVDVLAFEKALEQQKLRGRAARVAGARAQHLENLVALSERIDPTLFAGYTETETDGSVVGIVVDGHLSDHATPSAEVEVVLDRTPFYAESGGQVGDAGEIVGPHGRVVVTDTQRPYGGIVVHRGKVVEGEIHELDRVTARIDEERRRRVRPHHSATHLLHLALHEVLGPEATQAGSLVAPDRLRFDFRWSGQVTADQLVRIQERINELVFEQRPVVTREVSFADAVAEGAMALFGEKYGEKVRVVSMGPSKELCGGTHVSDTLEIGPVVIISESGIGAGIRRIEALAGRAAYEYFRDAERQLSLTAETLSTSPERLVDRAEDVVEQLRASEKRVAQLTRRMLSSQGAELASTAEQLNGRENSGRLLVKRVDVESSEDLRQLALSALKSLGSGVVVMGTVVDGKPQFVAAVSHDLEGSYNARAIAQRVGRAVGGGGGGSPSLSQGGGRDSEKLDAGLADARGFVRGDHPGHDR